MTTSKRAKRKTNELDIVIETPKGSRNKYEFDEKPRRLKFSGVLEGPIKGMAVVAAASKSERRNKVTKSAK